MDETKLMTSLTMLPSLKDYGNVNSNLIQINSARSVAILADTLTEQRDNFSSGVIDFNLSLSQQQRLSCAKSYFRAECQTKVKVGTDYRQPKTADNFALAENFMNNIISNSSMYIGSKSVSSVSQYHGVAAQLRSRLTKSYSWYQTIGKSVYYLDADFESRQKNITSDGVLSTLPAVSATSGLNYNVLNTATVPTVTTIVFAAGGGTLPNTEATWRIGDIIQMALQTAPGTTVQKTVIGVAGDTLTVDVPFLATQTAVVVGTLGVTRIRDADQQEEVADGRANLQVMFQLPLSPFYNDQAIPTSQIRFSIFPQKTKKNAFEFLEANGAGSPVQANVSLLIANLYFFAYVFEGDHNFVDGTYYMSLTELEIQSKALVVGTTSDTTRQFNIPSSTLGMCVFAQDSSVATPTTLNVPPSKFISHIRSETDNWGATQLQYSNMIKPVQLYQSEFTGGTQNIVQRYWESQSNSNMEQIGGESFDDWLTRGMIQYYSWIRPADDRSTSLQVQVQFPTITVPTLVFIASFYRKLVAIQVVNGEVSSVESLIV